MCIVDATKQSIAAVRTSLMNGGAPSPATSTGYPGGFSQFTGQGGFGRWVHAEIVGDPETTHWSTSA